MKNQTKFVLGAVAAIVALSALVLAASYDVFLNEAYEYSVSSCGFSEAPCRYSQNELHLDIEEDMYLVDPAVYSVGGSTIYFEEDVYCSTASMKCCGNGGCGGGGG